MAKNRSTIPIHNYKYEVLQARDMQKQYPHFKCYREGGRFFFSGYVQPSPTMATYKIRVEYRKNKMPKVKVLEPKLVENRPHYYEKQDCLCLYKPENFYWTESTSIADFIIGWATGWLYFYEVWLQTNIWYGPDAKHDNIQPKER